MAETDLDRLVNAWRSIDFKAFKEHAASSDPGKPVTESSMMAAEDEENRFLDRHPKDAQRWLQLKQRMFEPQLSFIKSVREASLLKHEGELADAAAPAFWMGQPGRKLVKTATFGYFDPVEKLGPPGLSKQMDRYAGSSFGSSLYDLSSELLALRAPFGTIKKLGAVAGKAVPAIGRTVQAASEAAPALTTIAKETAAGGAVGLLQKPREGETRLGNAAHMAGYGALYGTAGVLGEKVADRLLAGRAVGPLTEKAVKGVAGATVQGLAAAATAPEGERLEQGALMGLASIVPVALQSRGNGEKIYDEGLKQRLGKLRASEKKVADAEASNNVAGKYNASKEAAELREGVLSWRRNRDMTIALNNHGDLKEVAKQRAMTEQIGEATKKIQLDDAKLRELDTQEREAKGLLNRLPDNEQSAQVRGQVEDSLKLLFQQRTEILKRRHGLEMEEVKYGLPGMRVVVTGKSKSSGKEASIRAIVREVSGNTATVVDAAGRKMQVPLGALRPISADEFQARRAAQAGPRKVPPIAKPGEVVPAEKPARGVGQYDEPIGPMPEGRQALPQAYDEPIGPKQEFDVATLEQQAREAEAGARAAMKRPDGRPARLNDPGVREAIERADAANRALNQARAKPAAAPQAAAPYKPVPPSELKGVKPGATGRVPTAADVEAAAQLYQNAKAARPRDDSAMNAAQTLWQDMARSFGQRSELPHKAFSQLKDVPKSAFDSAEARRDVSSESRFMEKLILDARASKDKQILTLATRELRLRKQQLTVLENYDRAIERKDAKSAEQARLVYEQLTREVSSELKGREGVKRKAPPAAEAPTFTARVYRGKGRPEREEIYSGPVKEPLIPDATYYGLTPYVAAKFGPNIEERDVSLRKPLVLTSDDQFRKLVKDAGIRYPKFWMDDPALVKADMKRLRDHLVKLGHDGLVIRGTGDSRNELLSEGFGDDQVVVFREAGQVRPEVPSAHDEPIGPAREEAKESELPPAPEISKDSVYSEDNPQALAEAGFEQLMEFVRHQQMLESRIASQESELERVPRSQQRRAKATLEGFKKGAAEAQDTIDMMHGELADTFGPEYAQRLLDLAKKEVPRRELLAALKEVDEQLAEDTDPIGQKVHGAARARIVGQLEALDRPKRTVSSYDEPIGPQQEFPPKRNISSYDEPIGPKQEFPRDAARSVGGREVVIHTIGGKYKAHYALVELDDLLPSHRVDTNRATGVRQFVPHEHYPDGLQPRQYHEREAEAAKVERHANELGDNLDLFLSESPTASDGPSTVTRDGTVLAGNGRMMALKVAQAIGVDFGKYQRKLFQQLERYGFNPKDSKAIQDMRAPVLVRVVDMDPRSEEAFRFARETNENLTQKQSLEERMAALAAVIPEEALRLDVPEDTTLPEVLSGGSRAARAVIDQIYDRLAPNLRPEFFTEKGQLNDAGKDAVTKLLLGTVVDPELAAKQRPAIKAMLEKAIPAMAGMRELPDELQLKPHLEGALRAGQSLLGDWEHPVGQGFLGSNPLGDLPFEQQALVGYLSSNIKSDTALRKLAQEYVKFARSSQVFGVAKASAGEAIEGAMRAIEQQRAEAAAARRKPAKPGEAGMVSFGGAGRQLRRAWTRAMGGDERKAGEKWAYNNLGSMRPELADNFRKENLETTLELMHEKGLRPDQIEIVRQLEAGHSPDDVREAVAPETTPPQFQAMAGAAYAHALDIADQLHAKGALIHESQARRMAERVRDWWNPTIPPTLPTLQRLKELGPKGAVRTTEWWSARRYAGELAANTSQEAADIVFGAQRALEIKLKAFRSSLDTARGHMQRLAELTGQDSSGIEGLSEGFFGKKKLSVAELATYDVNDGLRRILGREGTTEEVEAFIERRSEEFDKLAPGAGRDWRNATKVLRNMYNAVRREYSATYGRELSKNIGEGLYQPHFFSDPVTKQMLTHPRLSRYFSDPIRSKGWQRFLMARSGKEGYVPDPISAAERYFPGMIRMMAVDRLLQERSPLAEAVFGRLTKATNDIGGDIKRATDGGELAQSPAGLRVAKWWNRLAANDTVDDRRLQIWIPSKAVERMRDVEGNPIKTPGAGDEGGYFHYIRSGRPLAPGDRVLVIREARTGSPEIVLPLVEESGKSPLRFMQWYSGGLQDVSTMFDQPGRLPAAVEWMKRIKMADKRAHWILDNRIKSFVTDLIYHNTLGVAQWKPIANNIAGGLLMASYHNGPAAVGDALGRYMALTRGADPAARLALLKGGVVEEEGVFMERAGGSAERLGSKALEAASKASFAGYSSAERMLRSVAFLAGHDKFLSYARGELDRLFRVNGIARSQELTYMNGRLYADGELVPDSERLGSLLDSTKRPTRLTTRGQLEAEIEDLAIMHGRAGVAKSQFVYSSMLTPQAFTGPVGRAIFQLNQYPIRSTFALWDAIANEHDPAKVARWIATTSVLGTAAYLMHWDVTSFIGPSIGSLIGSQTWDTDDETLGGQAANALAAIPLPISIPFSRGAPWIPLLSAGKGVYDILKGTLGLDPANPVPTGDHGIAELWAQFGRAVELQQRKDQSTLVPGQWRKMYEFANADQDETGRRLVKRRGGTLSPQSTGQFALEQLVPGSLEDTYASFDRGAKRQAREDSANSVSRAYRENLVSLQTEKDPEARSFLERQNEAMLRDHPELARVEASSVNKMATLKGLPIEVGDLASSSLHEKARGFLDWIEADHPGPEMLREASLLLWGDDFDSVKQSIGELKKVNTDLGNKVLGVYRKAMRREPVGVP